MCCKRNVCTRQLGSVNGLATGETSCLVKSRVDKLTVYCRDNNLKLLQACKKLELIETILNYRVTGLIKSAGGPTASTADHARTSSARECKQRKLSGIPSYEQVTTS